ncbi:hypothetical protein OSB04_030699, partial [Centaurea solstitialis]
MSLSASGSSSSSSMQQLWKYDVFLSFRGEDTRTNFVDHLYDAMFKKGLDVFKDDVALKRGEYISPTLLSAIESSRFTVVVLSKRYADSSFCLIELAKIMECRKKRGQIVLPVFYGVEASHVRKQTEVFGAGFEKHREDSRVNEWRKALVEAADISGWGPHRYEVSMIEEIIKAITHGLPPCNHKRSIVDRNLIGIEPRMQCVKSLMEMESGSSGVHMIGIWGIGGGGKTTLATAIYNEVYDKFDGRCSFVENIKEEPSTRGLKKLQEKVLKDVFKERYLKLESINDGKRMIEKRMSRFRVLIVLDDVNHGSQLEALAGSLGWFGPGSRIIITTRNRNLLEAHGVDSIHEVNLLKDWEAIHLFNRHAFPNQQPLSKYEELSLRVIRYTRGLPLALKVLGSSLCKKSIVEWESAVNSLQDTPNKSIFEILRISYDRLQLHEQEMFLDIACFFKNREKDELFEVLKARGFYPHIMLAVLIDNSLVRISNGNLQMHDLIQAMGHWIVRKEPKKHSRIWQAGELMKVFKRQTPMKKKAIKGIQVRFEDESPIDFSDAFNDMFDLRFLDISIFPLWKDRSDVKEPNVLPDSLQWLSWSNYPGTSLPRGFQAKNLVGMRLTSSKIVQLWEDDDKVIDPLYNLKMLDLSGSKYLTRLKSFHPFPNLEKLRLQKCRSLKVIHPSIGRLDKLISLDMSCCSELKQFPPILQMTSLEVLIFSGCSKLKSLPDIVFKLDNLKHLSARYSAIEKLPIEVARIGGLVSIDLRDCKSLNTLPPSFDRLECLTSLKLSGCTKLEKLPEGMK